MDSSPGPDSSNVLNYYNENKLVDFLAPEKIILREIRVSSRSVADSLLLLLDLGADFSLLAKQNSSINSDNGGLLTSFSRNQNPSFYDAASLLDINEISPVFPSSGNNFSIVFLVERIYSSPLPLAQVYNEILIFQIQ